MPGTKKRSIDIMETGENYGESNAKHENVHEFQISNIYFSHFYAMTR